MDICVVCVIFILMVDIIDVQEATNTVLLYDKDVYFPRVRPVSRIQYLKEKSSLPASDVCEGSGTDVNLNVRRVQTGNEDVGQLVKVEKTGTYECLATNKDFDYAIFSLPFEVKRLETKRDAFITRNTYTYFTIDCGIKTDYNTSDFNWAFTCNARDFRDQIYKDVNGRLHLYFVNEIKTNLTCTFNGVSHKTILSVVHNNTQFHKVQYPKCNSSHQGMNSSASKWSSMSTSTFSPVPTSLTTMSWETNDNWDEPFDGNAEETLRPSPDSSSTLTYTSTDRPNTTDITELPTQDTHRVQNAVCSSDPCLNAASCFSDANGTKYQCTCSKGFSGINCEIDNRICICNANGSCPTMNTTNVCLCPNGTEDQECVKKTPEFVFAINKNVSVDEGETAVLECFVSYNCQVTWMYADTNTSNKYFKQWNITGANHNRLAINNVAKTNAGIYRCACPNISFVDILLNVTEHVLVNADITPKDEVYMVNKESTYTCSSDEHGYKVTYYNNGKMKYDNGDQNEMNLHPLLVDHDSAGRGSCVQCLFEYKERKKLLQSCSLTISDIEIQHSPKKEISIQNGSDLNITVQARTKPETYLDFKMLKNGIPIDYDRLAINTTTHDTFKFLIKNMTEDKLKDYAGEYTIEVCNEYDTKDVKFSVVPIYITKHTNDTINYVSWIVPSVLLIVVLICFARKFKWIKKKCQDRKIQRTVSKEFFDMSTIDRYTKMPCQQEGFPRQRLRIQEILGEGNFGRVMKAEALDISGNGTWETVAVKMCKETATDLQKEEFSHELSLVKRIPKHHNVVNYLGYCKSSDQPTFIILEYISGGNLLQFLRDRRPGSGSKSSEEELNSSELSSFAHQIAKGLAHLSSHNIIHRDVAARNILISESHVCKVADLGLARDLYESDVYEIASKGGLPIRWMAPESLTDGLYTTQSDVWSYGVLLWEITTLGASPYPGLSARQVMSTVVGGNKLECPEFCSQNIKDVIMQCWEIDKDKRPTFEQICKLLEELLEEQSDYLNLQNYEEGIYSVLYPTNYDEKL